MVEVEDQNEFSAERQTSAKNHSSTIVKIEKSNT
jgi:hypothetical protein